MLGSRRAALGNKGPPLGYEQLVAGNTRTPNTFFTTDATNIRTENHRLCVLGGQDVAYLRLIYCGYYIDASNNETNIGNSIDVEIAIWIPNAPNPGPVRGTFAGATVGTMVDGTTAFSSDNFLPSQFGFPNGRFPAKLVFYVKDSQLVTAAQKVPSVTTSGTYTFANIASVSVEKMVRNNNGSSQVMTAGLPTGTATRDQTSLIAVVGKFYKPEVSLAFVGDDRLSGQNEATGSGYLGDNLGSGGPWVRAAGNVHNRGIPWINFGRVGSSPPAVPNTTYAKRFQVMKYATQVCVLWGSNAILNNVATATTVFTNLTATTAAIAALGIKYITVHKVLPRTTGAWTLADGSDQTAAVGFTSGAARDTLNTSIGSSVGSNGITHLFDVNPTVQLGSDATKWNADGVASEWTSDGASFTSSHSLLGNVQTALVLNADFATYFPTRSGA
jgi:hypothetical protein